jgi:glycosyltransferase involved in cell wall biosynthesis
VLELISRVDPYQVRPLLITFGEESGGLRDLVECDRLPLEAIGAVKGLSWGMLRKLSNILGKFRADLVHAHDLGPWVNAALCRTLRPSMKVIGTFHELRMPKGRMRVAATAAAYLSDAIVACGGEVERELQCWLPRGARLTTIFNGVALPNEEPTPAEREHSRVRLGIPPNAVSVGFLGRLHQEKQPQLLLDSFLRYFRGRADVHLVFIGGGVLEKSLRAQAAREKNVHVLGEVLRDAPSLLWGLDVYAHPSGREGRSLAMLEAMAAGLPTVAHDLAAVREIHVANQTALLVPLADAETFATALRRLVESGPLRERMGKAARAAARRHGVEQMVRQYASLYRSVLAGSLDLPQ